MGLLGCLRLLAPRVIACRLVNDGAAVKQGKAVPQDTVDRQEQVVGVAFRERRSQSQICV